VFIPTAAFLLISWLTFFYGAGARSERNDISIATLLASISNKYVENSNVDIFLFTIHYLFYKYCLLAIYLLIFHSSVRFVIGDHIPKVDYRTLLDIYLDFCFYLQLVTMFATVLVHWVHSNGAINNAPLLAERLNWAIFMIEFVVAYIFHEWIYFKVSNNELDIEHWVHRSKVMEMEEPGLVNAMPSPNPHPRTGGNISPRSSSSSSSSPRPGQLHQQQQHSSAAPLDSPASSNESYELEKEMIQLARRKQRSILVRFLQSLALEPDKHSLDDGSLMKSIYASEHFIHFGAVQISKKVLTDIKLGLESTLVSAQMKTQHVRLFIIIVIFIIIQITVDTYILTYLPTLLYSTFLFIHTARRSGTNIYLGSSACLLLE